METNTALHEETACLCEQTPCPCGCHQPKHGAWEEWRLREHIRTRVTRTPDLRGYTRQSRLAMEIAQHTGMSYPWIQQRIEELVGNGVRA